MTKKLLSAPRRCVCGRTCVTETVFSKRSFEAFHIIYKFSDSIVSSWLNAVQYVCLDLQRRILEYVLLHNVKMLALNSKQFNFLIFCWRSPFFGALTAEKIIVNYLTDILVSKINAYEVCTVQYTLLCKFLPILLYVRRYVQYTAATLKFHNFPLCSRLLLRRFWWLSPFFGW